ncbi:MAG: alpha-E domain-containing protein [bacterium]|nr:alpha-E domain-containing protein [bacterium]
MISRVAESCFWLTRYLERIDTWSRVLDVNSSFRLDIPQATPDRWRPLVIVLGQQADFLERFGEDMIEDAEVVQRYLVWDAENPCSILSSARAVRENARTTREVISVEMWELVNEFWLWLNGRSARRLYDRDRDAFYARVNSHCLMFHGTCYSTMLHDTPYSFIVLGRAVERAGQIARVLDVHHHALGERDGSSAADAEQWIAILRSCAAYEPFFKHTSSVLTGAAVAEFMLFDRTFPRSVIHNLDRTGALLHTLLAQRPAALPPASLNAYERVTGSLAQMDLEDVFELGLHETLTMIVDGITDLCGAIEADFFPAIDAVAPIGRRVETRTAAVEDEASPAPPALNA